MNDDLRLARRAVSAGAAVGLRHFAALSGLSREHKADGTVVTAADRDVEAAIREVIGAERPDDAILGEEGGLSGSGSRRWIIDPIDGTGLFVAGDDRWLVLLALAEDGEITTAVAAVPAQAMTWWAARGAGAFEALDDGPTRRIAVAGLAVGGVAGGLAVGGVAAGGGLATCRVSITDTNPAVGAPLAAVVRALPWDVHPALLVARGDLDLGLQTAGQVWDFAATSLIVQEAGGVYRRLDGGAGVAAGPAVYARDEQLATAALAVLNG